MNTMVKTQSVTRCPACNSEGKTLLENCRDRICYLPGNWSFKKCQECDSLWLDPSPTKEMIPSLYPSDYPFTHSQAKKPLQEPQGFIRQLMFAFKLGVLARKFKYPNLDKQTSLPFGFFCGKLLSYLPGVSKSVGYMVRFLSYCPQGKLLEVGTGNGSFLWLMSKLGWQVEGIEPDPVAAKAAKDTGLNVWQCGIEDADLEAESYDAIVLHHVLEHIPEPKTVLEKLVNCLKPGGVLVCVTPNPVSNAANIFKNNWYGLAETPRHLVLPSPEGYKSMLQKSNTLVKVSTTMKIAFWMYRESLSIQKTGEVGKYQKTLLPKIATILSSFLLPIFPHIGEEVICYATKR